MQIIVSTVKSGHLSCNGLSMVYQKSTLNCSRCGSVTHNEWICRKMFLWTKTFKATHAASWSVVVSWFFLWVLLLHGLWWLRSFAKVFVGFASGSAGKKEECLMFLRHTILMVLCQRVKLFSRLVHTFLKWCYCSQELSSFFHYRGEWRKIVCKAA